MLSKTMRSAAALAVVLATAVQADDTEIYIGENAGATEVRPNIIFVIDTSGSMGNDVPLTPPPYDPTKTYDGTCDPTRVYWSKGTNPAPACDTSQWFDATANKCKASFTQLAPGGAGVYNGDRMAMWKSSNSSWVNFLTSSHTWYVECKNDTGINGNDPDTSKPWAAEGSYGPWTSNSAKKINWAYEQTYNLYSANYLNYRNSVGQTSMTRLDMVKAAFKQLIDSTQNINAALMRFDSTSDSSLNSGGYFLTPMLPLDDTTRLQFKTAVDNLNAGGFTPLAETMYEAAMYYRGNPVMFGFATTPAYSHADTYTAATSTYISPLKYQCQKNFVIYFTDGDPTYDTDADTAIKALPGFAAATGSSTCTGDCLDELTQYLYKTDQSSSFNGTQNVITYTVGFEAGMTTAGRQLLIDAAKKGGGAYFATSNLSTLTDAFTTILTEILAVNTTFAAPAVTVNAFNRLEHRNELYFALFRPSERPRWPGNIKRYKLGGSPLVVMDADDVPAVDPNTGFFKETARSFWNTYADGVDVAMGGAASKIALPRKVYTYLGSVDDLTAASNALHETNSAITTTMLGVDGYTVPTPSDQRTAVLQWARGVDLFDENSDGSTTDVRTQMGDPIHTQPVLVTYGPSKIILFGSTNEGYLHALNTVDGTELFAFMPREFLPSINTLYTNEPGVVHPYGLDGPITLWTNDTDGNITAGDHVYLYLSMRRGGRTIYALNVTNPDAPSRKWTIEGGVTSGFSELGQTWSKPVVAKVKWENSDRRVLIFGGGYDPDQDTNALAQADDIGRAVYMVDAETGTKLWQAGPAGSGANLVLSGMTNSIPSEVRVADVDGNGYADRMYVGDMGGRMWRFNINQNSTSVSDFATGGILAGLGVTTSETGEEHNRRFYYPPSVSINADLKHLNIAIGSGYRSHPLNTTIHDRFFVLHDPMNSTTFPSWTKDDLYNFRNPTSACIDKKGFYIDMDNLGGGWVGEKVLAEALTLHNEVNFTTFTPTTGGASSACSPSQGVGRLYTAKLPTPASCATIVEPEVEELPQNTIPTTPQYICVDGNCTKLTGTHTTQDSVTNNPRLDYWQHL